VARSDLLRVYLRPDQEIRAEIEADVLPRVPGAYAGWLTVDVLDGVVTISGRVGRRSAVTGLVEAVLQAEGVIQVDADITPI